MLTGMLRPLLLSSAFFALSMNAFAQNAPDLDALVQAHDWPALAQALTSNPADQDFYRGLLLEHEGQYAASRTALMPLLPTLAKSKEALARQALAEDEAHLFHYREAAEQLRQLKSCCIDSLTKNEQAQAEIYALLAAAPTMTLEEKTGIEVPLTRGSNGLRELPVSVDGHPSRWLFDPTVSLARLSRAQAKAVGLKPLGPDLALIPQLRLGGALFRNVPVLLVNDDVLPGGALGVLPQSVISMLGTVTLTDDDHLIARSEALPADTAQLFVDDGQLLAATTDGQLFAIAPATAESALAPRMRPAADAKAGDLTLEFGATHASFQALKFGEEDKHAPFAGTLGGDALDQLAAYSFDFKQMRFAVRAHTE